MPDSPGHSLIRHPSSVPSSRFCSGCGLTLGDLRRNSRVGCANCYDAFADLLGQSIFRLHDATEHAFHDDAPQAALVLSRPQDSLDFDPASLEIDRLAWLSGEGEEADVVLSSRVRLARNLSGADFPDRADDASRQSTRDRLLKALGQVCPQWGSLELSLGSPLRELLRERHLLSYAVGSQRSARTLVSANRGLYSAGINEEDHLRLQTLQPGLTLGPAHAELARLCAALEHEVGFAFGSRLGYLTACPSNLGTGLRASVLLHLPALTLLNALPDVARKVTQAGGLTLRGPHGESSPLGSPFLQLSNQITLGRSSRHLLAQVEAAARSVADGERVARQRLLTEQRERTENIVWRAWGTLSCARSMDGTECLELVSLVRLGQQLELLPPEPDFHPAARFLVSAEPAHLKAGSGDDFEPNRARASWLRSLWEGKSR